MAASFEEKLASAVENLAVLYDKTLKEFKDSTKKKRMHDNKFHSSCVWSQVLLQRKNSRTLEPDILGKSKESRTSSDKVLGGLSEASHTFPYLRFLDNYISPRATKSNLVERREESEHEDNGNGEDENDDSYMETSSAAGIVEETESESTSSKAGSSKDHVSDSSASKQKQPKDLGTRKSKKTTTKVDMELELMIAVGQGLKTMCSSMQQQPQAPKEEKDEDYLFGVFVASQLKCMDQSRKARAKYHINNMIFQVMMSGPSVDDPSGFMQDLNSGQGVYLG